jgi:opacity protein-like surface antigen
VVAHQLVGEGLNEEGKPGWEVGAGLGFPLARGVSLTPGVLWTRYQHGSGAADGELLRVRHLRADVGLRLRF